MGEGDGTGLTLGSLPLFCDLIRSFISWFCLRILWEAGAPNVSGPATRLEGARAPIREAEFVTTLPDSEVMR